MSIFREKSLNRVSSPEQLDDYIRVTTPPVWLILLALFILIVGIFVWATFGSVTAVDSEGKTETIHPISLIMN